LVLKTLAVKPVRFDPLYCGDEAHAVLKALALASPVTNIVAYPSFAVATLDFTVSPVIVVLVISLATGVTTKVPLAMFANVSIPVPVTFAKVTLLVVATACPIDTTAAPALTPDPVIVTPVDPVAVEMKLPVVMLLVLCVWMSEA